MNGREPGSREKPFVLVTGATGYIGGRLAPVLGSVYLRGLATIARRALSRP